MFILSFMKKSLVLTVVTLLGLFVLVFSGTSVYADESTDGESRDPAKAESPKAESPKAETFTGEQLTLKKFMEELFEDSKKVNESGAPGKKARNTIESAVNWTEVAKICLGGPKAWSAQNSKHRGEFSTLLRDIIALTAYSRMGDFWNGTSYAIKKIDVKGSDATVTTTFKATDDDYSLEYYLSKSGRHWKINDLSFDDIKYSDNIREQIQSFLKEKNFSVLLTKLRKRRADLEADDKGKKKANSEQRPS
ncbi:MAG: ABC transporter substrate-binding protein [Bdellovibrionales bacterium]|nr:ABC transporter substrate-binding protein [Bdellovibrionales bacterium]